MSHNSYVTIYIITILAEFVKNTLVDTHVLVYVTPEKNDRTTDSPLPPIIASNGVTPCPPLVLPEEPTEYTTPAPAAAVVDQGVSSGENAVVTSGESPKEEVKEIEAPGTAEISEEASTAFEAPPAIHEESHEVSLANTTHEVSLATADEAHEAIIEAKSPPIEQDTSPNIPTPIEILPGEEDQPAVVPKENTATAAVVVSTDDATPEGLRWRIS
eukprot:sb/3470033/